MTSTSPTSECKVAERTPDVTAKRVHATVITPSNDADDESSDAQSDLLKPRQNVPSTLSQIQSMLTDVVKQIARMQNRQDRLIEVVSKRTENSNTEADNPVVLDNAISNDAEYADLLEKLQRDVAKSQMVIYTLYKKCLSC